MLVQARGDCKDIGIENNVFWRKPDLIYKDVISALADLNFALCACRPGLIHQTPSPLRLRQTAYFAGMFDENLFAFLK